jgi:uncharacterized protein (DUF2235 family)
MKNIIFCPDGTWNRPGEDDANDVSSTPTNVFKLFTGLAGDDKTTDICLADEQERVHLDDAGNLVQVAKYLHGVGDSQNFLVKVLGGAFGAGIISRIVRGYTFVSRYYEPGDKIFLIGFSRGAYTARALGGLIVAKGLLDATALDLSDKVAAYRLGSAVWYDWRRDVLGNNPDWLGCLAELIVDLPAFLSQPPTPKLVAGVPIEAIAVWDTVGALGIPVFVSDAETRQLFQFADTVLSPLVQHGFHAIAVDEERADFTPTLWTADPRILQYLWPGSHADVGGGYTLANGESRLSDVPRAWIADRLENLGVLFSENPPFALSADPTATAHRSYLHSPYDVLPHGRRTFPPGLGISSGLAARLAAGPVVAEPGEAPAAYQPGNIGGAVPCADD